jgi:hypothetical protein
MFKFDGKRVVGAVWAATIAAAAAGAMTIPSAPAAARVFFSFGFPAPYYAPYYGYPAYGYPGFFIGGGFGPHAYWHGRFGRPGFRHPVVRRAFHHPFVRHPVVRHAFNHRVDRDGAHRR